ncbi:hypothetical protein ACFLZI_03255 [Nitrospirota bacterium]
MKNKTVKGPNGPMDAVVLDVTSAQENWNTYLLEDGTVLKLKVVATEVARVEGHFDQEGNPLYMVKSTNVVTVDPPDELKK